MAVKLLCPFPALWHVIAGSALPGLPRKSHAFNYIHQRTAAALEADGGKFRHLRYARTCGCVCECSPQQKTTNSINQQNICPGALFRRVAGAFSVSYASPGFCAMQSIGYRNVRRGEEKRGIELHIFIIRKVFKSLLFLGCNCR